MMALIRGMGGTEDLRPVTVRFRALRERAGYGLEELALELGYRGASSLQRYEDANLFRKPYLPVGLAEKLADTLTGRGTPPITRPEVMSLAGIPAAAAERPTPAKIGADALKIAEALGVPLTSEAAYAIVQELPKLRRLGQMDLSTEEAAEAVRVISRIVAGVKK